MAFDECEFLIRSIQLQCDETYQKKCDRIRFDINDDVKVINKKIKLIKQRKNEFYNCGNLHKMYTNKPCIKSHLNTSDYSESEKCKTKLLDFYTTIQQQLDNYKKNPDPQRSDILYKKYVIHLYNSQKEEAINPDYLFIKKISLKIKNNKLDFDDDFLLKDNIEDFLLEIDKTIDDPIVFKIISFIYYNPNSFHKIKKHFDKIYQNVKLKL